MLGIVHSIECLVHDSECLPGAVSLCTVVCWPLDYGQRMMQQCLCRQSSRVSNQSESVLPSIQTPKPLNSTRSGSLARASASLKEPP